jgi:hypothetical protein
MLIPEDVRRLASVATTVCGPAGTVTRSPQRGQVTEYISGTVSTRSNAILNAQRGQRLCRPLRGRCIASGALLTVPRDGFLMQLERLRRSSNGIV